MDEEEVVVQTKDSVELLREQYHTKKGDPSLPTSKGRMPEKYTDPCCVHPHESAGDYVPRPDSSLPTRKGRMPEKHADPCYVHPHESAGDYVPHLDPSLPTRKSRMPEKHTDPCYEQPHESAGDYVPRPGMNLDDKKVSFESFYECETYGRTPSGKVGTDKRVSSHRPNAHEEPCAANTKSKEQNIGEPGHTLARKTNQDFGYPPQKVRAFNKSPPRRKQAICCNAPDCIKQHAKDETLEDSKMPSQGPEGDYVCTQFKVSHPYEDKCPREHSAEVPPENNIQPSRGPEEVPVHTVDCAYPSKEYTPRNPKPHPFTYVNKSPREAHESECERERRPKYEDDMKRNRPAPTHSVCKSPARLDVLVEETRAQPHCATKYACTCQAHETRVKREASTISTTSSNCSECKMKEDKYYKEAMSPRADDPYAYNDVPCSCKVHCPIFKSKLSAMTMLRTDGKEHVNNKLPSRRYSSVITGRRLNRNSGARQDESPYRPPSSLTVPVACEKPNRHERYSHGHPHGHSKFHSCNMREVPSVSREHYHLQEAHDEEEMSSERNEHDTQRNRRVYEREASLADNEYKHLPEAHCQVHSANRKEIYPVRNEHNTGENNGVYVKDVSPARSECKHSPEVHCQVHSTNTKEISSPRREQHALIHERESAARPSGNVTHVANPDKVQQYYHVQTKMAPPCPLHASEMAQIQTVRRSSPREELVNASDHKNVVPEPGLPNCVTRDVANIRSHDQVQPIQMGEPAPCPCPVHSHRKEPLQPIQTAQYASDKHQVYQRPAGGTHMEAGGDSLRQGYPHHGESNTSNAVEREHTHNPQVMCEENYQNEKVPRAQTPVKVQISEVMTKRVHEDNKSVTHSDTDAHLQTNEQAPERTRVRRIRPKRPGPCSYPDPIEEVPFIISTSVVETRPISIRKNAPLVRIPGIEFRNVNVTERNVPTEQGDKQ